MRIAVVERFAEPSRRCEEKRFFGAADEIEVWNLPSPRTDTLALLRETPAAIAGWLASPMPPGMRGKLLRASARTGGARLGALAKAPRLWRSLQRRDVERLACFSLADFELARLLAEATGRPVDELLARGTRYFGEFGFELLAVIPYAYWLHTQGRLQFTVSTADTRCLYYFSPNHEERSVARRYVPITEYPIGQSGRFRYDRHGFPAHLDERRWTPPPYCHVYRGDRFRWPRELCIVLNKASDERYLHRGFAVNYLDTELLLATIGRLRARYQVVYVRARTSDIVNDHQAIRERDDFEALKRTYPDVATIQELRGQHPDLSYNELQLALFAGCERFVSVVGGGAYLASYFGGTNIVYARRGWEVDCGAFHSWFHRFSGARVVTAGTPAQLLATIERELLAAPPSGRGAKLRINHEPL
jgi:hypothetical protein